MIDAVLDIDRHPGATPAISYQERIARFMAYESFLLDATRYGEWLELLTEDFLYQVPVPFTSDDPNEAPWRSDVLLLDESRDSLEKLWFRRHDPASFGHAWGENPRQRVRRFVTNVLITPDGEPNSYRVTSNVLLSFVRQSDPASFVPAGRVDLVRETDAGLRLARRMVYLDQTVITTTHMRLIF